MFIFNNNNFGQDTLNLRTQRLLALKTYIEAWQVTLSIPAELVTSALSAYDLWVAALGKSTVSMGQAEEAHQDMQEADETTFDYYMRCRKLLKDICDQDEKLLTVYGIKAPFPQARDEKMHSVQNLLDGNTTLIDEGDPHVLPAEIIVNLSGYLAVSNDAFSNYVLKEKPKAMEAVKEQNELLSTDTRMLRSLYSWVLMKWNPYEPFLIQLGFALRRSRTGGGQPQAPQDLKAEYLDPNLKFDWQAVELATSYQLAWAVAQKNWQELYFGTELKFTFQPASGVHYYKVRARNKHGFGNWSDIVSV